MLPGFRNGVLTLLLSIGIYSAQAQEVSPIINVPEALPQKELMAWKKKLPKDGWFILRFKASGDRLYNYSKRDYELNMWLTCKSSGKPGFLIEYSDNYRDGDFGGIDFISSTRDNGDRLKFVLDGKDFANPFVKGYPKFAAFTVALKTAKKLVISVYNKELNPETAKQEERLNRAIEFKLAHSELLDKPVVCGG